MIGHRKLVAAAVLLASLPVLDAARAAPYCVLVQGVPQQCLYADGRECQEDAVKEGGVCVANSNTVTAVMSGGSEYCLVDGGAASCIYADRNTCVHDATARHALCLDRGQSEIDPFATVRPYR